ncbi:MAG TPA: hypothetical protein VD793_04900 [Gemmatimonadales bacterium]|nr:hypothetical protein [Gemmatimonadales bacterium]
MPEPEASPDAVVLVVARDLVFRSKLEEIARASGWRVTRTLPARVAVLELGGWPALERVRELTAAGVPVLAFGSHVNAEALRAARQAGATAVPNSAVEATLRAWLAGGVSGT